MLLGQLLAEDKLVTTADVEDGLERQKEFGGTLGENLVALGRITPEALEKVFSHRPAPPKSMADTGLSREFLLSLAVRSMHAFNIETAAQIADELKLLPGIATEVLQQALERGLIQALGANGGGVSLRYSLTTKGAEFAKESESRSRYVGPAPVPLKDYKVQVERQRITNDRIDHDSLVRSLSHLVLTEGLVRRLGPTVNSGQAILLYGASGNGKTAIAKALASAFKQLIYVPYCIEVDGYTIKIFDPTIHEEVAPPVAENGAEKTSALLRSIECDPRWVRCRRPVVTAGAELNLAMLDLNFNPEFRFYEAPLQTKATGGIILVDDFGRQGERPDHLLNRWIIPLERKVDYLLLHTGKKIEVPFDELVIFSTNAPPEELMDEGMMRRLPYKIPIHPPSQQEYEQIFKLVCERHDVDMPDDTVRFLLDNLYAKQGIPLARYHPSFIVEHILAISRYEGTPSRLAHRYVVEAMQNLYLEHNTQQDLKKSVRKSA